MPRSLLPLALFLAISFQPVSVSLIFNGQVSALVFLWIAFAIWFRRQGWEYGSGVALSLCLSKPTVLILLLPMLGVGRRWRMLLGVLCGTALVGEEREARGDAAVGVGWNHDRLVARST